MKTCNFFVVVFLAVTAWPSFARSTHGQERAVRVEATGATQPQKWAFIFGSNSYADERRLGKLAHCSDDLAAMEALLVQRAGFPKNHIFVYHDQQPTINKFPMRLVIEEAFKAFVSLPGPEDQVIVVASLHGIEVDGVPYLCPMDADPQKPKETMLSVGWLYETLDLQCRATQKIVILDACRRPARAQTRAAEERTMSQGLADSIRAVPAGLLVLSSCISGQVSYEAPALRHGVFINFILHGLSGKADNRQLSPKGNSDGQVDVGELFAYAAKETSAYVAGNFAGAMQTPEKYGRETFPPIVLTGRPVPSGPTFPVMTGDLHLEGADQVTQAEGLTRVAVVKAEAGETAVAQMALNAALELTNEMPQGRVKEWAIGEIAKAYGAAKDFDGAVAIAKLLKDEAQVRSTLGHIVQAQADAKDFSRALTTAKLMAPSSLASPKTFFSSPGRHGRYEGAVPMAQALLYIAKAAADAADYHIAEEAIAILHYYSPSYGTKRTDEHATIHPIRREDYGHDDDSDGEAGSADGDQVRAIEKNAAKYVDEQKKNAEPKKPGGF